MIIVIQKNKICHLINRVQIEKFVYANNWHIIIFSVENYQTKKDGNNLIYYKLLFKALDDKENYIKQELQFYIRDIFVHLLANYYTSLTIENGAKAILSTIVLHSNNNLRLSKQTKIR